METNRVDILKALVESNPKDSFARYGLAMEYAKSGELQQAVREYEAVLSGNPDYAAAYFHGGQAFEKLGDLEEARRMYERGIEATTRTGDGHTRSELQAAMDLLPL